MPKFEKKEYWYIEDDNFDALVKELLGFEYECVAENEWSNDSSYTTSTKKEEINSEYFQKYELPEIEEAISSKYGGGLSFHQIITYLVGIGKLPEGNYLIDVSW